MLNRQALSASVCAAALLTASTAAADLTAQDVWSDWQELMAIYGEDSLSFTETRNSGGVVEIDDLTMSMDVEEEDFSISAELGTLTFTEAGDGTVNITMSESYPITVNDGNGDGVDLTVTQAGLQIIASGDPDDTNYAIAADRYGVVFDEVRAPEGDEIVDMRFMMNNLIGNYTIKTGEMRDIAYSISTGSLDLLADIRDQQSNGTFLISGKMNDLAVNAVASLPLDFATVDPEMLFMTGMNGTADYTFSSADYIFDFNDAGDTAKGSMSMGAGSFKGGISGDQLAYDTSLTDLDVNVEVPDLPFPVNFSIAEYGIGIAMPLSATEEPADVGLKIALVDVDVNEDIWMMGDPAGALSHDPVTFAVDLTGTAKLFFNLMDPAQQAALDGGAVPGEIHSLNLNDLTLRAAGAEVKGTGAFTFDNTDLVSFDGLPRPEGEVTVNINGANQLIDSLVTMGLLPEDQAMMGRMMMGMFARNVGDDQLTTTLSVNAEGHVVANGQRIK